jgi:hypothetical protein
MVTFSTTFFLKSALFQNLAQLQVATEDSHPFLLPKVVSSPFLEHLFPIYTNFSPIEESLKSRKNIYAIGFNKRTTIFYSSNLDLNMLGDC